MRTQTRRLLTKAQLIRAADVSPQTVEARIRDGIVRPHAVDAIGRQLFDEQAADAIKATIRSNASTATPLA